MCAQGTSPMLLARHRKWKDSLPPSLTPSLKPGLLSTKQEVSRFVVSASCSVPKNPAVIHPPHLLVPNPPFPSDPLGRWLWNEGNSSHQNIPLAFLTTQTLFYVLDICVFLPPTPKHRQGSRQAKACSVQITSPLTKWRWKDWPSPSFCKKSL